MKVYLEGKCNNNCLFCRVPRTRQSSLGEVKQQIECFDLAKDKRIVFTGSELTIRQDALVLLGIAKETKAEIVQLNTNGRMFSNAEFAGKVLSSGANYFKISIHGHNAALHDRITQARGSFNQTIRGIKNLIRLGQRDNIVLSIVVNRLNYKYLGRVLRLAKRFKIKKIQLNAVNTSNRELLVPLEKVAEQVLIMRYWYSFDFFIKTVGIPYCLIFSPESLFLRGIDKKDYVFLEGCRECKYNKICPGVLKEYTAEGYKPNIKAIPDLPVEVMIEVESRCNFNCEFCFNRVSFASRGFGNQKMETEYIKKMIDSIKKANVSTVRFTGGEPMLREDFFELIRYAKSKGLKVRLNTNGSLIESYSMVKEMVKYLDYVLFAMHAYRAEDDERITGFKGSFEKKIKAMQWFKKSGIGILRVNTIASLENIKNLEKFYKLFRKLKVDRWAVNRIIPISKDDNLWGQKEVSLLIEKLAAIKKDSMRRKSQMWIHIVNGIPFCAGDPVILGAISSGGRAVDGHERFAVDPRGFAKPIYYMDENIGNPLSILECWHHPFMMSMRSYELLPDECKRCFLLDRCKGGNRFCALMAGGGYYTPDPLMDFARIKKYIW